MESSGEKEAALVWSWANKSYSMPLSMKDVVTLARAVDEEGYPAEGVAWCLLNRLAWLHMHGSKFNLSGLVEAYAQPINPEWFPWGKKHQDEVARLQGLGKTTEANAEIVRARARPGKASKPWSELRPKTKEVMERLLTGQLPNPVLGAVHYWASRGPTFEANQAKKPGMLLLDRGYGFGPGRNVFFAESENSSRFGGSIKIRNGVSILPGGASPLIVSAGGNWGVLVMGGLAGYLAWKWMS